MRRLKKKIFLGVSGGLVLVLGAVRWTCPGVAGGEVADSVRAEALDSIAGNDGKLTTANSESFPVKLTDTTRLIGQPAQARPLDVHAGWHPVRSVHSYSECFPDVQDVQIVAARRWGVPPVRDREEAETRRRELVYVGASPLFCIDKGMSHSIPYLVPRASELLSTISRNYLDSLYVKGIPLHRIIVSSVLRTEQDVARLTQRNGNASDQSCHRFGTTFDIAYNRYSTVSPPGSPERRTVQNDTLKWVLSEVLRDAREQGLCYVKYEIKQGCFHITVR